MTRGDAAKQSPSSGQRTGGRGGGRRGGRGGGKASSPRGDKRRQQHHAKPSAGGLDAAMEEYWAKSDDPKLKVFSLHGLFLPSLLFDTLCTRKNGDC